MPKFRKKPVVIEAHQWPLLTSQVEEFMTWAAEVGFMPHEFLDGCITIQTLEGVMRADPGDWIIRGVSGEFYPCKPDIFEKTYEPV